MGPSVDAQILGFEFEAVTVASPVLAGTSHTSIVPVYVPRHVYTGPVLDIPLSLPAEPAPATIPAEVKRDLILGRGETPPDPTMLVGLAVGRVPARQLTRYRRRAWVWWIEQGAYFAVGVGGVAVGVAAVVVAVLLLASFL